MTANVEIQNRLGVWQHHCSGTIEWCLNAFDSVRLRSDQLAVRVVYGSESMVSKKIDSPLAVAFFEQLFRTPSSPCQLPEARHCPHCDGLMRMDDDCVLVCTTCGAYCDFDSYGVANASEVGAVACDNVPTIPGK